MIGEPLISSYAIIERFYWIFALNGELNGKILVVRFLFVGYIGCHD